MTARKSYEFTLDELCLLREAMTDYSHHLIPPRGNASDARKRNYRSACALAEQFTNDVRLFKE